MREIIGAVDHQLINNKEQIHFSTDAIIKIRHSMDAIIKILHVYSAATINVRVSHLRPLDNYGVRYILINKFVVNLLYL